MKLTTEVPTSLKHWWGLLLYPMPLRGVLESLRTSFIDTAKSMVSSSFLKCSFQGWALGHIWEALFLAQQQMPPLSGRRHLVSPNGVTSICQEVPPLGLQAQENSAVLIPHLWGPRVQQSSEGDSRDAREVDDFSKTPTMPRCTGTLSPPVLHPYTSKTAQSGVFRGACLLFFVNLCSKSQGRNYDTME